MDTRVVEEVAGSAHPGRWAQLVYMLGGGPLSIAQTAFYQAS